jgi:hypothetical protein
MPSFDVVSEIDLQEVRNAVDQTNREATTRFDFKNTNAKVEFAEKELTLSASTEDRLRALYQLLEEKMVKRSVSLKALDPGKIDEASQGAARQKVALKAGISQEVGNRSTRWSRRWASRTSARRSRVTRCASRANSVTTFSRRSPSSGRLTFQSPCSSPTFATSEAPSPPR